ncbi:hypothetical protein ABTX15_32205 [Micromonospora sp. NPDC094482]|uniref:hypothetical protein n=1 Tax=unclassified Micromonospora TaxID=2617518 RepID=UPI003322AD62
MVGDDVYCTDADRLRDGIDGQHADAILVKGQLDRHSHRNANHGHDSPTGQLPT